MRAHIVAAIQGRCPFSLVISNVRIVNVFDDTVTPGSIALLDGRIAYMGQMDFPYSALEELDGEGCYALPGFVDAHMHLESSMLTPAHFARVVLSCGTTTVAADPHEIGNVLGCRGVQALLDATRDLPLRVVMMAPSTIPSAPGFEDSGYNVGPEEASEMLDLPGVAGLGEVMDFRGVAEGEARILSVVEEAARRDCIIDGHVSLLTGRDLQAFRAAGIDSDHTLRTADKLREELALGFTAQIQSSALNRELVEAMNTASIQDRICLVTDDVPLPRLMEQGHLNHVVARAVALGLDPVRAVRFATINPARRMRLADVGAIAPGMRAELQLVRDLRVPYPEMVICGGKVIVQRGTLLSPLPQPNLAGVLRASVHCAPVTAADLALSAPAVGIAEVNVICQDGASLHTTRVVREMPVVSGDADPALDWTGYLKMAVFNRYGKTQHGLALIEGMPAVQGAVALTYGHDAHNLTVYGGNDDDMVLAANTVIGIEGGICAVRDGRVCIAIPLPLGGLMSTQPPEALLAQLRDFLTCCADMGFVHDDLMSFFTIMPLAVSPEIKCTDRGLLDVAGKCFLPLIQGMKGGL